MAGQLRWINDKVLLSAIGLVLGTALLGAGVLAYQREQTMRAGERLTSAFATVIDEQTSRSLQSVDQSLELLSRSLVSVQAEGEASPGGASTLLQAQVDALRFIESVMVLDARGTVAYASRAERLRQGMGDKDFVAIYKTRPGTGFFVAAPSLASDGQWLLAVTRPLTVERNGFAGVLVAMIKVSYFDQLWASLALESGSSVGLLRSDGQLLMRGPIDGTAMGRNFSDSPLFLQFLPASANGGYRIKSTIDGSDRFIAYRTLGEHPGLVIFFGRTIDAILAPWYRLAEMMTGLWLLGSLALLALSVRLARQSSRRQHAERTSAVLAQRLNVACEAAGLVLWDWDLRTDQWHVTPSYYTTLGYPVQPGVVSRAQWHSLMHPQDRDRPQLTSTSVASQQEQRYDHMVRMRHADGSYRWMRSIGQVKEWDNQRRPLRMIGVRMDVTERIKAEQDQRDMSERVSDAMVSIRADWTITHVNARAGKLLGHRPDQLIGKNVWDMFPDSSGHRFRQVYERCMASQQPEMFEEHYAPARVWYESHIYPSAEGLSVYFRDITQRKRSEQALRQAKEQAENLINGANVMVVGLDASGQITTFNKSAQELTGYTLADLAGRNWFEVLVPRERYPQVHAEFERLFGGGVPAQFENPILTRSGEIRLIAWHNSLLRDGEKVTGVLSFGMDVTSRRQAERDLVESKEQFETLARHSLQGIALVRKGQLVYINPALCTIAGRSANEIARLPLPQLMQWLHPDDRAASIDRQQRALRGEPDTGLHELRMLHANGQWRWIQSALRSITLRGEAAMLAIVIDIHERKLAELALRDSE